VALVHDTAMDGNVAAIGPMAAPFVENEPVIYEPAPILTRYGFNNSPKNTITFGLGGLG
jgi:hypothetical protein